MNNSEKLILDTHVLIWYLEGINLKDQQVKLIEAAKLSNNLYLSAISIWEIAMLVSKEKIILSIPLKDWIEKLQEIGGLKILDLSLAILIESCNLPHYSHKDPVDRMIIASAREIEAKLVTFDEKIKDYGTKGYLKIC